MNQFASRHFSYHFIFAQNDLARMQYRPLFSYSTAETGQIDHHAAFTGCSPGVKLEDLLLEQRIRE
jgi:hypothetical protein